MFLLISKHVENDDFLQCRMSFISSFTLILCIILALSIFSGKLIQVQMTAAAAAASSSKEHQSQWPLVFRSDKNIQI